MLKKKSVNDWLLEHPTLQFKSEEEKRKFLINAKNKMCKEYYILRQIPEKEMLKIKSFETLIRCKSAKEHWLNKGFNENDSLKLSQEYGLLKKQEMHKNNKLHKNGLLSEKDRLEFCRKSSCRTNSEIQRLNGLKQDTMSSKWRASRFRLPEYWIKQGFTEFEADEIISKLQIRNLEYFVNKYGILDGTTKFIQMCQKRKNSWIEKDKAEHAYKTRPISGFSKQEQKAIKLFLIQNNINENCCRFGTATNQFWQNIPNVGFRRYDLAVFTDISKSQLQIIFEFHGLFHSKTKSENDNECFYIGKFKTNNFINKSFENDKIKKQHILDNFKDVIYCVAWPENLKRKEMKIEQLRVL